MHRDVEMSMVAHRLFMNYENQRGKPEVERQPGGHHCKLAPVGSASRIQSIGLRSPASIAGSRVVVGSRLAMLPDQGRFLCGRELTNLTNRSKPGSFRKGSNSGSIRISSSE